MARYHQTIKRYEEIAGKLFNMLPDEHKQEGAELIARAINAGIVCNPRAPQRTVRLTILDGLCKDLPIKCRLVERTNDNGFTYNALEVEHKEPTDS